MGFHIGNFFIPYYGLLIIIGIIIATTIGCIQVKSFKLDINDFIALVGFAAFGGIVGAKLLYLLVSIDKIDWSRILDFEYFVSIMSGGFVFYGGLIGGLLMVLLFYKIVRINPSPYVDTCIPCIPIVHAFGRIGCSLVGCCYGAPYDGICSITYHNSKFAPNNISLFPIQAVEAILNIIIAIILLIYIYKKRNSTIHSLSLYLFMYSIVRFILEFFRYDFNERGFFMNLSTSQWISILLIITSFLLLYIRKTNKQKMV